MDSTVSIAAITRYARELRSGHAPAIGSKEAALTAIKAIDGLDSSIVDPGIMRLCREITAVGDSRGIGNQAVMIRGLDTQLAVLMGIGGPVQQVAQAELVGATPKLTSDIPCRLPGGAVCTIADVATAGVNTQRTLRLTLPKGTLLSQWVRELDDLCQAQDLLNHPARPYGAKPRSVMDSLNALVFALTGSGKELPLPKDTSYTLILDRGQYVPSSALNANPKLPDNLTAADPLEALLVSIAARVQLGGYPKESNDIGKGPEKDPNDPLMGCSIQTEKDGCIGSTPINGLKSGYSGLQTDQFPRVNRNGCYLVYSLNA